jgi:hypothetical protein
VLTSTVACEALWSQELTDEWIEKIDAALPATTLAKPPRPRDRLPS